jgi:hypothetical protein
VVEVAGNINIDMTGYVRVMSGVIFGNDNLTFTPLVGTNIFKPKDLTVAGRLQYANYFAQYTHFIPFSTGGTRAGYLGLGFKCYLYE